MHDLKLFWNNHKNQMKCNKNLKVQNTLFKSNDLNQTTLHQTVVMKTKEKLPKR